MEYSNPEIPEGINVSKEHPLQEFTILFSGIIGIIVIITIIISIAASRLAIYVPFEMEIKLAGETSPTFNEGSHEIAGYLQGLSRQLEKQMDIPVEMRINVHFVDSNVENAYASLGGNIYLFRGLIRQLSNENALAMVIAHEMAHIKHRDPLIGMGRGVIIGLLLAGIIGLDSDRATSLVTQSVGMITLLTFTRKQERAADRAALTALAGHYGHIAGSEDLFNILARRKKDNPHEPPQFLSTHPNIEERLIELKALAREQGWSFDGQTARIPDHILELLSKK